MSPDKEGALQELNRISRVSDMLCTAHASLRGRYQALGFFLDLLILGLSCWLVALTFADEKIIVFFTPFQINERVWLGMLSIGVFFLSLVQLKVDWKGRADAHKRSLDLYAEVKREARYLLALGEFNEQEWRRVLARYDMASAVGIEIPENEFLKQKRNHQVKIIISRQLDERPSASPSLLKVRFWIKDNLKL